MQYFENLDGSKLLTGITVLNTIVFVILAFKKSYHIVGKVGEFGASSMIRQTNTIYISTYD